MRLLSGIIKFISSLPGQLITYLKVYLMVLLNFPTRLPTARVNFLFQEITNQHLQQGWRLKILTCDTAWVQMSAKVAAHHQSLLLKADNCNTDSCSHIWPSNVGSRTGTRRNPGKSCVLTQEALLSHLCYSVISNLQPSCCPTLQPTCQFS